MKKWAGIILIGFFAVLSAIWWIETGALKKEICSRFDADSIERKGFPFSPKIACKNLRSKEDQSSLEGLTVLGANLLGDSGWVDFVGTIHLNPKIVLSGIFSLEKQRLKGDWSQMKIQATDFAASFQGTPLLEMDKGSFDLQDASHFTLDIQGGRILTSSSSLMPKNATDMQMTGSLTKGENLYPVVFECEKYTAKDRFSSGEGKAKVVVEQNIDGLFQSAFSFSSEQTCHTPLSLPDQESVLEAFDFTQFPFLETLCKNHWDQVETLLPDVRGTTKTDCAAKMEFRFLENQDLDVKKLTLDHFSLENERFGGMLKGEVSDLPGFSYTAELTLKNQREMLREFAGYYNRWHKLLSAPDLLGAAIFPANEKMAAHFASFLESISDKHTETDLTLSFKGSEAAPLIVGSQSPEILEQAMQKLTIDLLAEIELELKVDPSAEDVLVSPGIPS